MIPRDSLLARWAVLSHQFCSLILTQCHHRHHVYDLYIPNVSKCLDFKWCSLSSPGCRNIEKMALDLPIQCTVHGAESSLRWVAAHLETLAVFVARLRAWFILGPRKLEISKFFCIIEHFDPNTSPISHGTGNTCSTWTLGICSASPGVCSSFVSSPSFTIVILGEFDWPPWNSDILGHHGTCFHYCCKSLATLTCSEQCQLRSLMKVLLLTGYISLALAPVEIGVSYIN